MTACWTGRKDVDRSWALSRLKKERRKESWFDGMGGQVFKLLALRGADLVARQRDGVELLFEVNLVMT